MWPFKKDVLAEIDSDKRKRKRLYKLVFIEALLIAILLAYIYSTQFRAAA